MTESQKIHIIDALIAKFTDEAPEIKERYQMIPRMPKGIPSEFRSLWADIAFSFMFGRYFSALCVCGSFVEYFLEKAIPKFRNINGLPEEELPRNLSQLMKLSVDIGLVSQNDGKILQGFREHVRNKFSHGDLATAADSLFAIKGMTMVYFKDGEPVINALAENQLSALRDETLESRLNYVQWEYAKRTIPWIGTWVRRTALTLWPHEENER